MLQISICGLRWHSKSLDGSSLKKKKGTNKQII